MFQILEEVENPHREGLRDTPKRWARFFLEFLAPTEFSFTTFSSEGMDEMIVLDPIPLYSLCEHHLAPFFGHAYIGYLPNKRIVGLSKIPRTLDYFSRRLQNQERITSQVAQFLFEKLKPKGVGVVLKCRHFCMEMRGVQKHDVNTTTTKLIGAFKTDSKTRSEFLSYVR